MINRGKGGAGKGSRGEPGRVLGVAWCGCGPAERGHGAGRRALAVGGLDGPHHGSPRRICRHHEQRRRLRPALLRLSIRAARASCNGGRPCRSRASLACAPPSPRLCAYRCPLSTPYRRGLRRRPRADSDRADRGGQRRYRVCRAVRCLAPRQISISCRLRLSLSHSLSHLCAFCWSIWLSALVSSADCPWPHAAPDCLRRDGGQTRWSVFARVVRATQWASSCTRDG